MRLLNVDTLEFTEFRDHDRPKYVIASHRWLDYVEAQFKDVRERRNTDGLGYKKIKAFAEYIRKNVTEVQWLWIDTCCINRDSDAELSEAINLMFQWYRHSELCIAYLADVEAVEDKSGFANSQWFKRGWTLQELLAPCTVIFVTKEWQVIGNKGGSARGDRRTSIGPNLEDDVATITGIPIHVLQDYSTSRGLSVDEKLKWMNGRKTTREEDMSYALYGIFDVTPGANYGERHDGAKRRLTEAIYQQSEQFEKILAWLQPPDPTSNHASARYKHKAQTGEWLIHCDQYKSWKAGATRHVWLYGKAGCGKTILCSTAIDDIRSHCQTRANVEHAVFYFSFSDDRKQTYRDLVLSLVAQLGWKEPGLSMLRQAYEKHVMSELGVDQLEEILISCIMAYEKFFLMLDALDECPEGSDVRHNVLEQLKELSQLLPHLQILVTSREVPDVGERMESLNAGQIAVTKRDVDADIERYVSDELSRDRRLDRLNVTSKEMIRKTIAKKADGMFQWAYCQLQELKRLPDTRPKYIETALLDLPADLDETYARMLTAIKDKYRLDALLLLRWLAYAKSPPTLSELVDAVVIDPTEKSVDLNDRGSLEGPLNLLYGLVTIIKPNIDSSNDRKAQSHVPYDSAQEDEVWRIGPNTSVRLAHFSVKEYLESSRILQSSVRDFHLELAAGHQFIAQSCITYIIHYSEHDEKTLTKQDLDQFPLIKYAARSWYYHSFEQQRYSTEQYCEGISREASFLSSEKVKQDWLVIHNPDIRYRQPFNTREYLTQNTPSGLYYASLFGLETVAKLLVEKCSDINAQGGEYGNALCAASERGHTKVVELLIEKGANVNARGGRYFSNALCAASNGGHLNIVELLIEKGANINAQGGRFGNALCAASERGYLKVAELLIAKDANINAQGGLYDNALCAASRSGHTKIVELLIEKGANINAQGRLYGNALCAASESGHLKVAELLIEKGININAQGGRFGNALCDASNGGYTKIVELLIEKGANINAQGDEYSDNALCAASNGGHIKIVELLIEKGANINAQGGRFGNALCAASERGHLKVAELLIEKGININAQGGYRGNALYLALSGGHEDVEKQLRDAGADVEAQKGRALEAASTGRFWEMVKLLLNRGADVKNLKDGGSSALRIASSEGQLEVVKLLLDAGVDVNAQRRARSRERNVVDTWAIQKYGNALEGASYSGHQEVVKLLLEKGANVNAEGFRYANALQAASGQGHPEIVKLLAEKGAISTGFELL